MNDPDPNQIQRANNGTLGAAFAVGGVLLLSIGTLLHPIGADPNDPAAAFAEYAGDRFWIASHLVQLAGMAAIVAALLFLTEELESKKRSALVRIATAGAIVSLALATALQAVDGIALKRMVDLWAATPEPLKQSVFHAAFAVRQIEIGLASMLSLVLGFTITLYSLAVVRDETFPNWFAGLGIAGSVPTIISGIVIATTGFSGLAMAINMPTNFVLLLWMLALARLMWRHRAAINKTSELH
ncbi:MAG: hypothetical protein VCB25_03940 [Myxococcota bacterium]